MARALAVDSTPEALSSSQPSFFGCRLISMTAPVEKLPTELFDIVVRHLALPSLQSFRLASRHIYAFTLPTFCSRYYSRRTTTLSVPSLSRLLDLSSCAHLAPSVSLLDVKLLNHEDYQNLEAINRVGIFPPPKRFQQVANIKPRDIRQEYALFDYMRSNREPKDVVRKLCQALGRLSNIRTIRLRVSGESLGWNFRVDDEEDEYLDFTLACLRATLNAIIQSNIKIQEFSLIKGTTVRPSSKSANLIYPAFNVPFPLLVSLGKAFTSLKTLCLSIRTDYNGNARVPGWQNGISQFISTASALEKLTLCFQATDTEPSFRAAVMQSLAASLHLPDLISLQLYGCAVDEQVLTTFIKAHSASLRQLVLNHILLLNGSWTTVLGSFRESLSLATLHLSLLRQNVAPRSIRWICSKKSRGNLFMDTTGKTESRSMSEMLTEAIGYLESLSSHPDLYT
jgi:hypothetical protein